MFGDEDELNSQKLLGFPGPCAGLSQLTGENL